MKKSKIRLNTERKEKVARIAWTEFSQREIPEDVIKQCTDKKIPVPSAVYANSFFYVVVYILDGIIQLSIKPFDPSDKPTWKDLQQIKNEIVSRESEAIELFPAESRCVESEGHTYLWVLHDQQQYPIGFGFNLEKLSSELVQEIPDEDEEDFADGPKEESEYN